VIALVAQFDPNVWGQWGLAGLVMGTVLWLSHRRDVWLREQNAAQQRWIQERLLSVIEHNTTALNRVHDCMVRKG
jgi:hypothetical protein